MPIPKSKSQVEIEKLWNFEGRDAAFWVELLRVFCGQLEAASGMILAGTEDEEQAIEWVPIAVWPDAEETRHRLANHRDDLVEFVTRMEGEGDCLRVKSISEGIWAAALPLRLEESKPGCIATFIRYGDEDFFRPGQRIEQLMIDSPLVYGASAFTSPENAGESSSAGSPLSTALNLGLLLNEEKRFLAAAMVLCNELAVRFSSDRVSLGWVRGHYVRLKATNHAEKINRKMEISRLLEAAMEECLDQDDEIVWPGSAVNAAIEREHERYARHVGITQLASIPIRKEGKPLAAITLERSESFSTEDLQELRLTADLCYRRLSDLHETDRWFGARLASSVRRWAGNLFGHEHTWTKLGLLSIAGVIAFLFLYPWDFKVKTSFVLQPEQVFHLPSPFDGYIQSVEVKAGDQVTSGQPLVLMDTSELELNKAELAATVERFVSEAQLARAEATPAEMHIAIAKAEETRAALKKVQFNLEMATISAPVDGVVLEGDLKERIGSPVARGEALMKLSPLEGMFAELQLPESEAIRVISGSMGEAAFESQPDQRYPVTVEFVEPLAVPEEDGNVLIVHARFLGEPAEWWRPGMSGIVKIDCGERPLIWILTRQAVDYLRMRFWF